MAEDGEGLVGGAVVENDEFVGFSGLVGEALELFGEEFGAIVGAEGDRDRGGNRKGRMHGVHSDGDAEIMSEACARQGKEVGEMPNAVRLSSPKSEGQMPNEMVQWARGGSAKKRKNEIR
jgi:hypothetical protein